VLALHNGSDAFLGALGFEVGLAQGEETRELAQVVAGDRLHDINVLEVDAVFGHLQDFNQDINALEVFSLVEEYESSLPELFGVNWGPVELSALDLLLPLLERAEFVIVLVEVLPEALEKIDDLRVNPGAVLQLGHKVKCVDH
jgi:hypothetical protein